MRSTLNRHNSALTLIQEAVASCRKSVDALIQAKDKATTDLFFNSTILDILKHRNLNTAEREMEIVKYKLQSAISIYPEIRNYLPQHELLMDTTKPNSIVDSLFDNVVSDYYIREQIQKSLDTILSTTNSLTLCKNNLQKDPDQMKSQYGQIQTDYMNAWKNLKEYRREIMLGWIQTEKDIINGDSPPEYSD
ncbi:hypothetical protein BKA69DRAFT_617583 [Paraphysoderma sedebokerense]|nr:hypothetical protein BKA69DRAFT_617583 [Paraphysoderma sedebokerense]